MDSRTFTYLRKLSGISQADVAAELGVSIRTITNWESATQNRVLALLEAKEMTKLMTSRLVEPLLPEMCEEAFAALPSEMVAVWVVDQQKCLLLSHGSRYFEFENKQLVNLELFCVVSPLTTISLTTYPLRSGEIINLAGDDILYHPQKKRRENRTAPFLKDSLCESMLHVPVFTPSLSGPRPVLLLSIQNKLNGDQVIPSSGRQKIYSEDDEKVAVNLAKKFRDKILPIMKLLDMVPE